MVEPLGRKLEFEETLGRRQIPNGVELFLPRKWPQCRCEVVGILFAHETKEIREVEHTTRPVDLVHTVCDVRGNVNETGELDFIAHGFEALGNLEGDDTTIRVTSDGIRAVRLCPLDGCSVGGHHLVHGTEERVPRFETPRAECVEGPLVLEVLGKVDEDEDFTDTGVNHEDGGLVSGEVEGNDGIVLLGARVLGNQGVNVLRQAGDDRVLEDLDGGYLGQLKRRLSLAFESDNIDGGTTELEEVLASRYVAHVEVKDVSVDASQRLLSLSGGGDEAGTASDAQQLLCAGDMLGKSALLELVDETGPRKLSEGSLLHLSYGDRDNELGWESDHLHRDIAEGAVRSKELGGSIFAIEVECR